MRLLVAGIILGQAALAGVPTKSPVKPVTAAPAITDTALAKAIRARFARSKIAQENFQVAVEQGVATIDGKTGVIQRKGTATRLARLAGAKSVRNRIEISQEAKDKAEANLAKGRRRAQVKRGEARK